MSRLFSVAASLLCAAVFSGAQRGSLPANVVTGRVSCANLIYAVNKSSVCFSDRFLRRLSLETKIETEPKFRKVRLDDAAGLSNHPFAIMTGEGGFQLTERERINLRYYLRNGGFLVASAGCSSPEWIRSFRREFSLLFPGGALSKLSLDHPAFRTVYAVKSLQTTHGGRRGAAGAQLEGYAVNGRLALVFSPDGLNDTAHAENCCCCGGDEIANAEYINVNLLAYALLH
jgi:hypothetical protein